MNTGRVARIRVNPKDCMSAVDIARKAGVHIPGMSFGQLVSIAFSSMLEAYRQCGHIPIRDGFEFTEVMAPFADNPKVDRARKLAITHAIQSAGSEVKTPPAPLSSSPNGLDPLHRERLDRRWNELALRKQLTPENMSVDEERELERLHEELGYPPIVVGTIG